jgi:hypothetical protein
VRNFPENEYHAWHHTDASDHLKEYYSKELLLMVLKILDHDFKEYEIPYPNWVIEVLTGIRKK